MEKEVSLSALFPVMQEAFARGNSVTFTPYGNSMCPMLREGRDRVELQAPLSPLQIGDVVLYRLEGGQFVLHRIVGSGERGWYVRGDNQKDADYPVSDAQIFARMTAFTRNGRSHSARGGLDRFYFRTARWTRLLIAASQLPRRILRRITR